MKENELKREVLEKVKEAFEQDGFFITITGRKKDKLFHYQASHKFAREDAVQSLDEIFKMVKPDLPPNVTRMPGRRYE